MKPTDIKRVLNLAYNARKKGFRYNPCFSGAPGLGKSEIVQQWCNEVGLPFIDLRGAYLEAPDLIGFPSITLRNGKQVTAHSIPDFWPDGSEQKEGVLFVDEINRSTTAVLNTFMQLLTDRKVHKYDLPSGWLIVTAINPENGAHDVNTMDSALKDRLEMYEIKYNKQVFLDFMRSSAYHPDIISFVETGAFKYQLPEDVGDIAGAKYISPRTWSKVEAALKSGVEEMGEDLEMAAYEAALGRNTAMSFHSFRRNETPVTYQNLIDDWKASESRLKKFSDPNNYRMAQISITIRDVVENYDEKELDKKSLVKFAMSIPADQAFQLFNELSFKMKVEAAAYLADLFKFEPKLKKYMNENLKAV